MGIVYISGRRIIVFACWYVPLQKGGQVMKKREKMVLAALLVSLGLFSYPNAAKYVEGLSENVVKKMIKAFDVTDSEKLDFKNEKLLIGNMMPAKDGAVG